MSVVRPLIASEFGPQLFQAAASTKREPGQIQVSIYSVNGSGKKTGDHATCIVEIGDKSDWLNKWKRNAYLIHSRIKSLEQGVVLGESHNVKRGLAYGLFGALVDYGKCYQGMEQVILNSHDFEATAQVRFQTSEKEENHHISPFWIDSLGHIAGFIMNANDGIDSKSQVSINHGWEYMRCTTKFSKARTYTTYNRMQNIGGTMYAGDTYVLDGDDIVAIFGAIKFQGVPRQALNNLLPSRASASSSRTEVQSRSDAKRSRSTGKTRDRKASTKSTHKVSPKSPDQENENIDPVVMQFVSVVADEVGLDASELAPSVAFPDIGVDSLLSLTIASRLRDEYNMDVSSDLFTKFSTVKEAVEHLSPRGSIVTSTSSSSLQSRLHAAANSSSNVSDAAEDTDLTDLSDDEGKGDSTSVGSKSVKGTIRKVIAAEIGIDAIEVENDVALGDLGVDALLSLTMLDRLREELPDLEAPSNVFADHNSLNDIAVLLGVQDEPKISKAPSPIKSTKSVAETSKSQVPRSSSLLLQGNLRRATKVLFLFPDGSGSATSYASLPTIASDIAVIGLNCPFMKTPEEMKCSLEDVTPPYVDEIRRRQPQGPYYFSGWSAGGICAMDAAQEFIRRGETIERLVLIDSPNPIDLDKLPPRLYDFSKTIGLFGESGRPPPAWLLPHFLAFIDSLDTYEPKPFAPDQAPETHIIWAKDGVCKYPDSCQVCDRRR